MHLSHSNLQVLRGMAPWLLQQAVLCSIVGTYLPR